MTNSLTRYYLLILLAAAVVLGGSAQLVAQQTDVGYLKAEVKPGRAGVFVDGKYMGPASNFRMARKYTLTVGEHELVLREPRYEDYKTTVRVEAGKTATVSQSMQPRTVASPPFGTLKAQGFVKYAPVFVNGAYMGHADEFNGPGQGLLLNPGDYNVTVTSHAGDTLLEQKVAIRRNEVVTVQAN